MKYLYHISQSSESIHLSNIFVSYLLTPGYMSLCGGAGQNTEHPHTLAMLSSLFLLQMHFSFIGKVQFRRALITIYGHGSTLGQVTRIIWTHVGSPTSVTLHMKFDFDWSSGFGAEDVLKWWTMTSTHGTTTEPAYTLSSTINPQA